MKKAIVLAVAVLALPTSVALAAKPAHPAKGGKSNPMVMYVLKGTFTSYQPATADQEGLITIDVKHSNFHSSLKGQSLTFNTTMKTKFTYPNGATVLTPPANGVLKFKAPLHRKGDTTLVATLTANAKALHVIDKAHQ